MAIEDYRNLVIDEVVKELASMAEHPSLSGDMRWAFAHAAKVIDAKKF